MTGGSADSIEFAVHVRPGGRRDAVEGRDDGVLAVRVSAPPTDGRANDAVPTVLATAFGVKRGEVAIIGGHKARRKRVRVDGVPAVLQARLAELLAVTG